MKQREIDIHVDQVIEMAWADDVSFEKIRRETSLNEADVIKIMRGHLKAGSFRCWRKRVSGRLSKHEKRARLLNTPAE